MAKKTTILKKSRTHDSVDLTLRDIIMKDILTSTELNHYCDDNHKFDKLNIYIDLHEYSQKILFNLSINSEPAFLQANEFEMFLITGRDNDSGNKPFKIYGTIETQEPDTLVSFKLPVEGTDIPRIFSEHKDGYSYLNYVIYGILNGQASIPPNIMDARERIMMCKGKIYRTNALLDYTENILDGQ